MMKNDSKKGKTGPKPDLVKIDMDWEKAVGKALEKKRPKDGWPEETQKPEDNQDK